jgi:hypothetical protein
MVTNAEEVTKHFGYWPEFADGRIFRFAFEAIGVISLTISYGDAMTRRSGEIDLRFTGVFEAELNELRAENVLDALRISEGQPMEVLLEAAYGLDGSFRCESASVVEFRREAR